jgi:AbiV family abortive infection protein
MIYAINYSKRLLASSEILLKNGGDVTVCAGLYICAIEEFGKMLFLREYNPVNGLVTIKYRSKGGFLDHDAKIKKGLSGLPPECMIIGRAGFEEGFEEGFEYKNTLVEFGTRNAFLYADFDASLINVLSMPVIDPGKLQKELEILKTALDNVTIP